MTCKLHPHGFAVAPNQANPNPGKTPPEVLDYVTGKTGKASFDHRDVWREEHAVAFAVAKATELEVVQSMHEAVTQALKEGLPFEEFQKRITPTLQEKGWWGRQTRVDPETGEEREVQLGSPARLKIIFHTNVRTARAAGQWKRIEAAKKALPYLRYRHGNPQRARPDHESWDGRVLPVDHEWWNYAYPPNGYGCTCWVEQISSYAASQAGITPDEDVDMQPIEVRNPRTGQTTTTIRGVQPTFAYNAGKARLEGLKQAGVIKSKPPKPPTPPKPKPPELTPEQRRASALAHVADGAQLSWDEARARVGALVQRHLPAGSPQGFADRKLEVQDLTAKGWGGYNSGGRIVLDTSVAAKIKAGPADAEFQGAMEVLLHEELHSYGPASRVESLYRGEGATAEEVTTEVLARYISRGSIDALGAGLGYRDHVVHVINAIQLADPNLSLIQAEAVLIDASLRFKALQDAPHGAMSALRRAILDSHPKLDPITFMAEMRKIPPL